MVSRRHAGRGVIAPGGRSGTTEAADRRLRAISVLNRTTRAPRRRRPTSMGPRIELCSDIDGPPRDGRGPSRRDDLEYRYSSRGELIVGGPDIVAGIAGC